MDRIVPTRTHAGARPWATQTACSLVMACASGVALGAPAPGPAPGGPESAPATRAPLTACTSLTGHAIDARDIALPTGGARIEAAQLIPPEPARPGEKRPRHATPEYCAITGVIAPVDPTAPPIRFQLNVPTAWNHKAVHVGGGGLNGRIPPNLAEVAASGSPISGAFPPDAPYPLALGYANYGGDSGHDEPGLQAGWALHDEAWTNFGHAALKKTRDAAYAVLQALYGTTPSVNYFMGQSQGGREALEVAQRYPGDYDGVVATAPLLGYVPHVLHKAIVAGMQTGPGWIPPALQPVIGAEVMRQCDALDGLVDGIISHYQACAAQFDPVSRPQAYDTLRCPDDALATPDRACLSAAQIATLHRMRTPLAFDYPLANGWTSFPGYGVGREGLPSWLNLAAQPAPGEAPALGQPGATVSYGILKDPKANPAEVSLTRDQAKIQAASALIDSTNTDLTAFFARGGRLIVKVGSADYNANPRMMMRYYDEVVGRFGQAKVDEHVRFYVQPDGNHNGEGVDAIAGKPIPQYVNLITLMTDWVEHGTVPPDAPVITAAAAQPPHTVSATRPLCRYPLYPHYDGQGDTRQAASFRCVR